MRTTEQPEAGSQARWSDDRSAGAPAGGARDAYRRPGWVTRRIMNPLVLGLGRVGASVWGARVLEVRGRSTGEVRSVPVNLLRHDGARYLVAPRGEAEWVRNVRAARGAAMLRLGRDQEVVHLVEVPLDGRPAILRAYLARWGRQVGPLFDGVDHRSGDDHLRAVAHRHPVFVVDALPPGVPGLDGRTAGA